MILCDQAYNLEEDINKTPSMMFENFKITM